MNLKLGINTGFALNRFPLPEEWMKIVGEDLGLHYIQLTADMLNPALGEAIVSDYITRINKLKLKYNITIDSVMTGAFTRVNHFSHPDKKVREYWISWFKKFVDIGVALGATNLSSHFGILSHYDLKNPIRRMQVLEQTVNSWKEIAVYAKSRGMAYLSWEPMSIPREYGETIEETKRIQGLLADSAIPIKLCLDVDHGDVSSPRPEDTDPYAWLREFAQDAPLIHLKQSLNDKSGHWPFTPETNKQGKIVAEKVVQTLAENGCKESLLLLEFSFREREPFESRVLQDLKTSVQYWRQLVAE